MNWMVIISSEALLIFFILPTSKWGWSLISVLCTYITGQVLECSLAKPQADQKSGGSNSQKSGLLPNYPPRVGYGFVGGAYGAVNPGYGASGFGQV